MKKFFYFAVLLLGVVACNNDDESSILLNDTNITIVREGLVSQFGSFDPQTAPTLFAGTGKKWEICYDATCDEEGNIAIAYLQYYWTPIDMAPGYSWSLLDVYFMAEDDPEKNWTYDPGNRTITVSYPNEYNKESRSKIEALSEDLLLCIFSYEVYVEKIGGYETQYCQQIYVTDRKAHLASIGVTF